MCNSFVTKASVFLIAFFAITSPVMAACFNELGTKYNIEPNLLKSIAYIESRGNNKAINLNTNGTKDVCMMQINSSHFKRLDVSKYKLLNSPCTCIEAAAILLRENMNRLGANWKAIAAYNAGPANVEKTYAKNYARKVIKIYNTLNKTTPAPQ